MLKDYVKKQYTPEEKQQNLEMERQQALFEEAGLEDMTAQKLRDTMLTADEAIEAKAEQLENVRIRKSRKTDWDEYVDAPRRWGRALHHSEIISRLRQFIPGLYVQPALQSRRLSLYIWDRNQKFDDKVGGTVFLAWIEQGWNPEYEIDIVNDVGIAIGQKRGWRTLLLRLICRRNAETFSPCSIITEDQAYVSFGYPSNGPTASNFRRHLHQFRNTSPERAKLNHEIMQAAQKYMR